VRRSVTIQRKRVGIWLVVLVRRAYDAGDVLGELEHRVLKAPAGSYEDGIMLARVPDAFNGAIHRFRRAGSRKETIEPREGPSDVALQRRCRDPVHRQRHVRSNSRMRESALDCVVGRKPSEFIAHNPDPDHCVVCSAVLHYPSALQGV